MSIKPILFNTEMVRAILDGRKTCDRRAVKYKYSNTEIKLRTDKYGTRLVEIQKDEEGKTYGRNEDGSTWHQLLAMIEKEPPYEKGDILYVRETFSFSPCDGDCNNACNTQAPDYFNNKHGCFVYRTNYGTTEDDSFPPSMFKWHPSVHMPKEAARIWLRVKDVRVERLQDITEEQAVKEGVSAISTPNIPGKGSTYIQGFGELWNSTVDKKQLSTYGWDANPYVWVIEFERCEKPESEG